MVSTSHAIKQEKVHGKWQNQKFKDENLSELFKKVLIPTVGKNNRRPHQVI